MVYTMGKNALKIKLDRCISLKRIISNASSTSLELAQFPSTVVQPLLLGCFCLSVLYLIPGVDNMPKLTAPRCLFVFCVCVCVCARFVPQQNKLTYFCVALNLGSGKKIIFWWGFRRGRGCLAGSGSDKCCLCGCKNKKNGERKKIPEPDPLLESETADDSKKATVAPTHRQRAFVRQGIIQAKA